jgi:hypothetical protein
MGVPAFLSSSFRFLPRVNVSDVQTIMDDFANEVAANGWTNPSANLYKSPPNTAGQWFDVLLTRVTQNKLEIKVRDFNGVTVSQRRIYATTANTWQTNVYVGQFHYMIDVYQMSNAPLFANGGLLDVSPEAMGVHTHVVWGNASSNTSDGYDYNTWDYAQMVDNVTGNAIPVQRASSFANVAGNYGARYTTNGSRLFKPREFFCYPTGQTYYRWAGRCHQMLICSDDLGFGAVVTVPISENQTGKFKVAAVPAAYGGKILVRIA